MKLCKYVEKSLRTYFTFEALNMKADITDPNILFCQNNIYQRKLDLFYKIIDMPKVFNQIKLKLPILSAKR